MVVLGKSKIFIFFDIFAHIEPKRDTKHPFKLANIAELFKVLLRGVLLTRKTWSRG
jgi:hypothetical protein